MNLPEARAVLELLVAAFPTYPFPEDTAELYLAQLQSPAMPNARIAAQSVQRWVREQQFFPKVSELLDAYHVERRYVEEAERQRGLPSHEGTTECNECGEGYGWVDVFDSGGARLGVRPCASCEPAMYEDWRDGHLRPDHNVFGCSSDRCKRRAKSRRRG